MRILINAVSAKMGGAATYIRELASHAGSLGMAENLVFLVPPEHVDALQRLAPASRVIASRHSHASKCRRLWFDQVGLRRLLRDENITILFSTANFGLLISPCRQALLVCNSIYFSRLYRRLFGGSARQRFMHLLQRWLVWCSVHSSKVILTPSQTMLSELQDWMCIPRSKTVAVLPYGVSFVGRHRKAENKPGTTTLLFTSLYADHKNLSTLLRALRLLVVQGRDVNLVTTADPNWPAVRETRDWKQDSRLARSPGLADRVHFAMKNVGLRPDDLYQKADIFVYPSVVESFGHPLIEAMAQGLPIVAADVPINREICRDAALFFDPFNPGACAATIEALLDNHDLRAEMSRRSLRRSQDFHWHEHISRLVELLRGELSPSEMEGVTASVPQVLGLSQP